MMDIEDIMDGGFDGGFHQGHQSVVGRPVVVRWGAVVEMFMKQAGLTFGNGDKKAFFDSRAFSTQKGQSYTQEQRKTLKRERQVEGGKSRWWELFLLDAFNHALECRFDAVLTKIQVEYTEYDVRNDTSDSEFSDSKKRRSFNQHLCLQLCVWNAYIEALLLEKEQEYRQRKMNQKHSGGNSNSNSNINNIDIMLSPADVAHRPVVIQGQAECGWSSYAALEQHILVKWTPKSALIPKNGNVMNGSNGSNVGVGVGVTKTLFPLTPDRAHSHILLGRNMNVNAKASVDATSSSSSRSSSVKYQVLPPPMIDEAELDYLLSVDVQEQEQEYEQLQVLSPISPSPSSSLPHQQQNMNMAYLTPTPKSAPVSVSTTPYTAQSSMTIGKDGKARPKRSKAVAGTRWLNKLAVLTRPPRTDLQTDINDYAQLTIQNFLSAFPSRSIPFKMPRPMCGTGKGRNSNSNSNSNSSVSPSPLNPSTPLPSTMSLSTHESMGLSESMSMDTDMGMSATAGMSLSIPASMPMPTSMDMSTTATVVMSMSAGAGAEKRERDKDGESQGLVQGIDLGITGINETNPSPPAGGAGNNGIHAPNRDVGVGAGVGVNTNTDTGRDAVIPALKVPRTSPPEGAFPFRFRMSEPPVLTGPSSLLLSPRSAFESSLKSPRLALEVCTLASPRGMVYNPIDLDLDLGLDSDFRSLANGEWDDRDKRDNRTVRGGLGGGESEYSEYSGLTGLTRSDMWDIGEAVGIGIARPHAPFPGDASK